MTRRAVFGWAVLVVLIVIPAATIRMRPDRQSPADYHAMFLENAELFKRRLLEHVPLGSQRPAVWDYLEAMHAEITVKTTGTKTTTAAKEVHYWIPLSNELHPVWHCERGQVGVLLILGDDRLASVQAQSWNLDCL